MAEQTNRVSIKHSDCVREAVERVREADKLFKLVTQVEEPYNRDELYREIEHLRGTAQVYATLATMPMWNHRVEGR